MGSIGLEAPKHREAHGDISANWRPDAKVPHAIGAVEAKEIPGKQDEYGQPHIQYDAPNQVPIAIVGMAVRLPGGVRSTDSFWDLMLSQRDVSREVPKDRYNIEAFYSDSQSRAVKVRRGFFLDDDLANVDLSAFKTGPIEAGYQDPQLRLLLEVIWECMDNAGQVGWRGKDIGCYVGNFGEDWLEMSLRDPLFTSRYHAFTAADFNLSNSVSYQFDLRGPSMTIRTACSASMSGLHVACQSLASKECSSAIVAGSNIVLTPTMTKCMSESMVLAPDGTCKTFDREADGYGRGEAVNAIYIKRLDDAVRDGDPIRAVIRSTMNGCDGQASSMTIPSAAAQESLIRKAYARAGISDPSRTGLFECHGTGTAAGDLAETQAISRVFGDKGVYIGGVKPNVGHSEGASGLTSIIKGVLALEHRAIPPNARIKHRNEHIPPSLRIAEELTPWPEDRDERISVNSFGIGGANSHVILESARSHLTGANGSTTAKCSGEPKLVTVSATSSHSLQKQIENLRNYVKCHQVASRDFAHTLGARRDHNRYRAFAVINGDNWVTELPSFESGLSPPAPPQSLVFVFTGQGAQWPGMAKELMSNFDTFRADIERLDEVLQALPHPPSWSMQDKICVVDDPSIFVHAEFAQPLCVAIQIALVNLLASWSVVPTSVVGHSSGEIAAAYAAKCITKEAAITIAYYRGQAAKSHTGVGGMVAVGLGTTGVTPYLQEGVQIACENSPRNTVLSGDNDALTQTVCEINSKQPDILTMRLDVNTAYHSHHMVEVGHIFEEMIKGQAPSSTPKIPIYSTVLGRELTESDELDSLYWRKNLERPVLFSATVELILIALQNKSVCFLEVGPHCPLAGPLREIFADAVIKAGALQYIPTLHKNQNQAVNIMQTAGRMHLHGIDISLDLVNGPGAVLTDLPPYPWDHSAKRWMEGRVSNGWRFRQHAHHELLGSRALESNDIEPSWRNILRLDDSSWLCDHKFSGCIVYPGAAYIAAAGEAIRQVSGHTRYVIKNLFIKNALFLDINEDVELMTVLRPVTLTDILDSDWYHFTIYSYKATEWRRHCTGEVTGVPNPVAAGEPDEPFLRHVDTSRWYRSLRDLGLDYGPSFRGIDEVTADPVSFTARGTISRNKSLNQESYAVHPTIIDQGLQLIGVAVTRGIIRHMDRVAIPVSIDRIYCGFGDSYELRALATCQNATEGNFVGNSTVFGDSETVLDIRGVRSFGIETEDHEGSDHDLLSARIEWELDIECLPSLGQLLPVPSPREESEFSVLEQLCTLLMIKAYQSIEDITPAAPHLLKYKDWLAQRMQQFQRDGHPYVTESQMWISLEPEQQNSIYTSLSRRLDKLGSGGRFQFAHRFLQGTLERVEDIFRGLTSPIEVLMSNDLEAFYNCIQQPLDYKPFFSALGRSRPSMRVLEIGAGTGGMTASTLQGLETEGGVRMFSEYVFTDISTGFFSAGRERFKNVPRMTFRTLDITHDPVEQGFDAASFDLIVCSNVLHATPSLQVTLSNVRRLLVPGGYLFLQELWPESNFFNSTMGLLEGWWVGESDGRVNQPLISPGSWDQELRTAGFTGTEAVAFDNCQPYQTNANMISRVPLAPSTAENISLLIEGPVTESARLVEQSFIQQGYTVTWCSLTSCACENVVSLLELDSPFFSGVSQDSFDLFREFICKSMPNSVVWVTKGIQMDCNDPNTSLVLGMARCIRLELSVPFATVEMDSHNLMDSQALVNIYRNIHSARLSRREPDYEYFVQDGSVYTSRYYPTKLSSRTSRLESSNGARQLQIGTTGLLDSLHWTQEDTRFPGQGEMEIDVRYVALNFKDIMVAMGFVGNKDELGCEATGIVRSIGPGPHHQDFQVGDHVFLVGRSTFRTSIVTKSTSCCKVPAGVSLEEAAAIPCVYATALHCLVNLACLERGQSVLIHSACGGVGLAAIQLSQTLGAEIFATVGTDAKAQHLVDKYQIPRNHIFNSRSSSFKDGVLRETNGRGVDVVLNSLSGESLHASWECVAEFGKMVEIGKRDMMGRAKLDMDIFLSNRSFFGVDLYELGLKRPTELSRTLKQIVGFFESGGLKPIMPTTVFDAEDVLAAFRYMQSGQHIGKILVKLPEDPVQLPVSTEASVSLSPTASYLLIGGLGGLGMAVARWMVECGARSLIFFSRSAGQSDNQNLFCRELKAMGCTVITIAGDVASPQDVQRALHAGTCAVAGVIHLAMVLRDQSFEKMTREDWLTPMSPKIYGTWNLYQALQNQQLDFFVGFGSLVSRFGNIGQANYAAANCFLTAFAKYSRAQGFPIAVVDLPGIADIGYVGRNPQVLKQFGDSFFKLLGEQHLLRAVQAAITQARIPDTLDNGNDLSSVIVGLTYTGDKTTGLHDDVRFALYRPAETHVQKGGTSQVDAINHFLAAAERDPSMIDLQSSMDLVLKEITRLIRGEAPGEDLLKEAAEIPIDSLMTIEIRSWLRKRLNIDLPTMKIAKVGNIGGLSKLVLEILKQKYQPQTAASTNDE